MTTEFTVKRSEWGQGSLAYFPSGLRRNLTGNGAIYYHKDKDMVIRFGYDTTLKRCCLGFLGNACGVPDEEMYGHGMPFDSRWPGFDQSIYEIIARVNDSDLSPSEKERQLTNLFASIDITVHFVD